MGKFKQTIIQWGIPGVAFLIVLTILLVDCWTECQNYIEWMMDTNNKQAGNSYCENVTAEFEVVQGKSDVAVGMLKPMDTQDDVYMTKVLGSLVEHEQIYAVAYCTKRGDAILHNGAEVSLTATEYFEALRSDKAGFIRVENDGIFGRSSYLYIAPVKSNNVRIGNLIVYMDDKALEAVFDNTHFNQYIFFALVDEDGRMMSLYGDYTNSKLVGDDFWNSLEGMARNRADWTIFARALETGESASVDVETGDERRLVYRFPIEGTDWDMVMCLDYDYVSSRRAEIWKPISNLVGYIFLAIACFVVAVLAINITHHIRTDDAHRKLKNEADTDQLTDLYNKIATEREIRDYLQAHPDHVSVMFVIDVDNFKKINDTMGHAFGDKVLRSLGVGLQSMFRVTDIVGRVGGDEFIIFLKNVKTRENAEKEGRKLEQFFRQLEVGEYVKYSVTASIGGAVSPADGRTFEDMYKAADVALYTSKRNGKNRLSFCDEK